MDSKVMAVMAVDAAPYKAGQLVKEEDAIALSFLGGKTPKAYLVDVDYEDSGAEYQEHLKAGRKDQAAAMKHPNHGGRFAVRFRKGTPKAVVRAWEAAEHAAVLEARKAIDPEYAWREAQKLADLDGVVE